MSFKPNFRRQRKNRQMEILEPIFTHMIENDIAMSHGDIIHAMMDLGHSSHMIPTRVEVGQMASYFAKYHEAELKRSVYELHDASPANVYGTRKLKCFRIVPKLTIESENMKEEE